MKRFSIGLSALLGIAGALGARLALGADSSCSHLAIEADADARARWPELPERIREALDARTDIDGCASVRLTTIDGSTAVQVALPDGRSASRSVSRREDVIPTVEALLLLPRHQDDAEASVLEPPQSPTGSPKAGFSGSTQASPEDIPSGPARAVVDRGVPTNLSGDQPSRVRIELSAITGVRIGDGQTSVGLGALSLVDLDGWLVGFEARADRYEPIGGIPVELAVLGGRRFRLRALALDLVAGPAAVLQGTSTFETKSPTGQTVLQSSSSTAPRLLLGTRLNFGARSAIRAFVGFDGEIGPARMGGPAQPPGAPRLPLWTVGLALGGTVGTV